MRLPELLGFLLMSVCVFLFVERRSSPLYALVAVIFPIATIAYGYAYEARAYGLVLGFSAAALLCWQVAAEAGPHRRLAALGTAVSLAAAVASHYYAVLILLPLLVGEATRSTVRKRIDWLVLGSFCGALVPLLAFSPLIAEAKDYSTSFWAQPTWHSAIRFYPDSLMDRPLGVVWPCSRRSSWSSAGDRRTRRRAGLHLPPSHELAALVTLVLLPFFGVALGKLATGAYTDRYVLSALVGITILIALAAWWIDAGVPKLGLSLLLMFALFAGARIVERNCDATEDADGQAQALDFLDRHRGAGEPIVVASPHDFFELSQRVARDGGPRLIYLADPALARRYLETDAVELGVTGMKDIAPLLRRALPPIRCLPFALRRLRQVSSVGLAHVRTEGKRSALTGDRPRSAEQRAAGRGERALNWRPTALEATTSGAGLSASRRTGRSAGDRPRKPACVSSRLAAARRTTGSSGPCAVVVAQPEPAEVGDVVGAAIVDGGTDERRGRPRLRSLVRAPRAGWVAGLLDPHRRRAGRSRPSACSTRGPERSPSSSASPGFTIGGEGRIA